MKYQITNQRDLRQAFWDNWHDNPTLRKGRQTQNDYDTDTRCAWVDFVDAMQRDGVISEALAQRATL